MTSSLLATDLNLTAHGLPKAPCIINHEGKIISPSDYGREQVRKLMTTMQLDEASIDQIMSARTIAKLGHGYKTVTLRRSGERYIDHTNGVFLLLLLELGVTDPDLLSASHIHDFKEDVMINHEEMENLIKRAVSEGAYHIMDMVTNPIKTGDEQKDRLNKLRHYAFMSSDIRACLLKTADRCYNLRSLEIMHLDNATLTNKQIEVAEKQTLESRDLILPLAKKCGKDSILVQDIEKVEKRIAEFRLFTLQNDVKSYIPILK